MRIFLWLIGYAYFAFCLQMIAGKTGNTEDSWMAWIPIVNIYLLCKMAGMPGWWVLLFFIPLVNIVIIVLVWMEIASALGKSNLLGLLMIIPFVNLIVLGYLAFSERSFV